MVVDSCHFTFAKPNRMYNTKTMHEVIVYAKSGSGKLPKGTFGGDVYVSKLIGQYASPTHKLYLNFNRTSSLAITVPH